MNFPSRRIRRGQFTRGVFIYRKLLLCICFCIAVDGVSYAFDKNSTVPEGYSSDEIKGFMNHLAAQGEYTRARLELYRLRSFFPLTVADNGYLVTEAYFLYHEKRYGELVLENNLPPGAAVYKCDAFLSLNRFSEAETFIKNIKPEKDDVLNGMMARRMFMVDLLNDRPPSSFYNGMGIDQGDIEKLARYSMDEGRRLKKTWAGAVLGILPGAGYMYGGEVPTGIVASIVISGLSVLTYYAFRTDNRPAGIFLGAATVFFYGGSILGGYRETVRFNNGLNEKRARYLEEGLGLAADREKLVHSTGLVTDNETR